MTPVFRIQLTDYFASGRPLVTSRQWPPTSWKQVM